MRDHWYMEPLGEGGYSRHSHCPTPKHVAP